MRTGLLIALILATAAPAMAQENAAAIASRLGSQIELSRLPDAESSVEWGQAIGVVDAPPSHVMGVIRDYANYDRFMPKFRRSRILSQRGRTALVYLEAVVAKGAATLWAQMRIQERPRVGDTHVVNATMIQGNVDRFAARWEVTPIDGGQKTLVLFKILVDPDMPLPSSLFSHENYKAARKTLKALRRRMRNLPSGTALATR